MKDIYLAGGCFWGVEAYFKLYGFQTECVYIDGDSKKTTYDELKNNVHTHKEAIHLIYDEKKYSLRKILELFLKIIDPTSVNKQGNDKGIQYASGIYYTDEHDRAVIVDYLKEIQKKYFKKIVIIVKKANNICRAEEYHQNYLDKHKDGYCHIDLEKYRGEINNG